MCDLAYVLLLDQLERQVLADRQVAATLRAAGADVQLPSLGEKRAEFDAALVAEPQGAAPSRVSQELLELRQALGVA